MKIYLDTADLSEIEAGAGWGFIDGLTTNPTLLAKQGHSDLETTVKEICGIIDGPVSVEVTALDTEGMLEQGRTYAPWADNVVVKVPLIPEGLAAVRQFSDEGIATNVTLCFSANQALFAARAGATYISPFLGRLDDISQDGMELIRDIAEIYAIHDLPTEIIAASIRHPVHILEAAKAGAHIATCPFAVVKQSMKHPLTDAGLEKFMADWRAHQGIPDTVGAV